MFPEADTICYIFVGTSLPQFANIPSQWQLPSNPISPELDFVSWFCLNHQCWLYMNVSLPVFGYPFCFTYLESVTALLVNRVSNLTPTGACCCFMLLLCSFVGVTSLLSTPSVLNTGSGQLFSVLTMCLWKLQADVLTCGVSTVHWAKQICCTLSETEPPQFWKSPALQLSGTCKTMHSSLMPPYSHTSQVPVNQWVWTGRNRLGVLRVGCGSWRITNDST